MSDDRIAESPSGNTEPDPPPNHPVPDVRLPAQRFRFDGPASVYLGVVTVAITLLATYVTESPGLLILLAVLAAPAAVRMARLVAGRPAGGPVRLLLLFIASLGVTAWMALAAGAGCFAVCTASLLLGGNGLGALGPAFLIGGVAGVALFLAFFIGLWPRQGAAARRRESPED